MLLEVSESNLYVTFPKKVTLSFSSSIFSLAKNKLIETDKIEKNTSKHLFNMQTFLLLLILYF